MNNSEKIIGTTSVENFSTGNDMPIDLHPGLTEIVATYPENYAGQKTMVDGQKYKVSKETADLLVSKGIAVIVIPDTKVQDTKSPAPDNQLEENVVPEEKINSNFKKAQAKK